jgi:hypothetical protein
VRSEGLIAGQTVAARLGGGAEFISQQLKEAELQFEYLGGGQAP